MDVFKPKKGGQQLLSSNCGAACNSHRMLRLPWNEAGAVKRNRHIQLPSPPCRGGLQQPVMGLMWRSSLRQLRHISPDQHQRHGSLAQGCFRRRQAGQLCWAGGCSARPACALLQPPTAYPAPATSDQLAQVPAAEPYGTVFELLGGMATGSSPVHTDAGSRKGLAFPSWVEAPGGCGDASHCVPCSSHTWGQLASLLRCLL